MGNHAGFDVIADAAIVRTDDDATAELMVRGVRSTGTVVVSVGWIASAANTSRPWSSPITGVW